MFGLTCRGGTSGGVDFGYGFRISIAQFDFGSDFPKWILEKDFDFDMGLRKWFFTFRELIVELRGVFMEFGIFAEFHGLGGSAGCVYLV